MRKVNTMKIQSLQLKNFRCFADVTVNFHDKLTVLVGVNGSGKTSILDALGGIDFINKKAKTKSGSIFIANDFSTTASDIITISAEDNAKNVLVQYSYSEAKNQMGTITEAQFDYIRHLNKITYAYYTTDRASKINFADSLAWFEKKETEEARYGMKTKNVDYTIAELDAVRSALAQSLGEYENPYMELDSNDTVNFYIRKKGTDQVYMFDELSAGYKTTLALVMDLARRMAVANADVYAKENKSVLKSPAIVLIDEIDLHLHPSWQQRVLPDLTRIFPNTQFIVTTHSPQVLTGIPSECIRVLKEGKVYDAPAGSQGAESSRLLKRILGVDSRPPSDPVTQNLEAYKKLVYADKWDSTEAKELRQFLVTSFKGEEPTLTELDLHIDNRKWELGQ